MAPDLGVLGPFPFFFLLLLLLTVTKKENATEAWANK